MSIKDLFNNPGAKKIQGSVTSDELVENVESEAYVEAKRTEFEQFVPPIDFVSASNFAKFGSAELYYEKAFERIHQYYPYDGTLAEKTEFHNSSSYLDKHVFDNLYPRTNGYVVFNETTKIDIFGGPHTASAGMIGKTLESTFDSSMIYDEAKRRDVAFEYKAAHGCTIEFWLKKDFPGSTPTRHRIVDMTNSETGTTFQLDYLRNGADNLIQLHAESGSTTTSRTELMTNAVDGTWHHYAFSIFNENSQTKVDVFKDGQFISNKGVFLSTTKKEILDITAVSNGMQMTIGGTVGNNLNRLSGSMDEFRFWKVRRTPEQIYNSWFTQIGGGTNKHDANLDLGLYFKFNEGITGTESLDQVALDYSGRINNGRILGYSSTFRNTGSAIQEKLSEPEFLDPIIYSSHPDVVAKKAEYKTSGSLADLENTSMLLGYFPGWMQEEDEQSGKQLKYLSQVIGSYFDTLWHQINFVDRVHDNYYVSGSNKALPFAKKLVYDRGFVMPDLFVDATITENLLAKDDSEVYEKQINEVRNTIYHNLYNNLETIYKSKGTEKAFRNFFRSLGIGQDVVKLRMYADDSTFVLRNNYEHKSFEKKYLNFNHDGHHDATVYQTSSVNNFRTHIPADRSYSGSFTIETEVILPRKRRVNELGFLPYASLSSSIVGYHQSGSLDAQYTHPTTDHGISLYVVKEKLDTALNPDDSHRAYFLATGSVDSVPLHITSSLYSYQYENNKWNLAVRLRHENYPYANVTGNIENNYVIEFYGVEADGSNKRNSFYITSSIPSTYFTNNKIFYAGAHRANFTGSAVCETDIKLGNLRYWHSYLSNDAIDQHAYDPETFGANEPFENDLVLTASHGTQQPPREKTLALHWAFNDLTTSDGSGELLVSDLSSGSLSSDYGPLSDTVQRYVQGRGIGFNADTQKALDKTYIQTARKRLPDDLMSSDLTTIKSDETEQFFIDDDVSDNFYSFEKSMQGTISDEMMSMFSTALDLNNLIGQPNQKYHHRYNMADFLRDRFYDDVENEPDLEKFTSFYKWIDDSISIALQQLVPASTRFSEKINNVVESHVLERNKYVHQVPILTTFQSTEGSIKGISEMKYDWKHGHAPFFPEEEQTNVLWQRERKKKTGLREDLRNSRNNHSIQSAGLLRKEIDGSTRISDVYAVRRFAKTYDLSMASKPSIHGGINFERRKNVQLFHESIAPAGPVGPTSETPQNIITVGVGDTTGIIRQTRNDDNPPRKKKFNSNALVGKLESSEYGHNVHGNIVLPLNLMSGTVHSGYNLEVKSNFASDVVLSNLHHDVVGNYNETSIQGPFTEAHIGGLQYRHIDVNKHDSSKQGTFSKAISGVFPTASIEFDLSVITQKFNEGVGSHVTVRDGDGTIITTMYSNVFDLYDNQWTNIDDLAFIINNKLDMKTNKVSESFLELTQSVTGNFYNYTLQTAAHGYITASGFGGGTDRVHQTFTRNLDSTTNRPEGWGLVFKDHPSQGDTDGAFGFIGADYSTPYPSSVKLKATRYREETAKRPVNIKNIKTLSTSQKAGNYSNAIQLFSVAPEHQKTWAIEAYSDPNIDIVPPFIATSLPKTTHYQTLIGVAPLPQGNTFGAYENNRQTDGSLIIAEVTAVAATGSFEVTGAQSPAYPPDDAAFRVSSSALSTDGHYLRITTGGGQVDNYEVEKGGGVTGGYHSIDATAGNTVFWDDLKNTIASDISGHTVAYSPNYDVHSIALSCSAKTSDRLESTTVTGDTAGGGTGLAFHLYFQAFGGDEQKSIYVSRDSTNQRIQHVYIQSGSLFTDFTFEDSGGTIFTDQYKVNNFTSSYGGQRIHVAISHNGTFHASNAATVYVNGTSVGAALAGSAALGSPSGTKSVAATTKVTLFNSDGAADPLFAGGSTGPIYLDDVVLYPVSIGSITVGKLYNDGELIPSTIQGSPYAYYNFQTLTAGTALTNGQSIPDSAAAGNNNHLTAIISAGSLIPTTGSGNHQIATAASLTAVQTPGYAQFSITNAPVGANNNLTITNGSNHESFSNFDNAVGGTNIGAFGAQDDDRILFVDSNKAFLFDDDGTSDVAGLAFYVQVTGSDTEMWDMLRFKMEQNTNNTVRYTNLGGHKARFHLTASITGIAGNDDLTEVGSSFFTELGISGGVDHVPPLFALPDNTITRPRTDLTSSERNINTRFSAPGGPEIQTIGYLDAHTQTYSVHNAMPFRNLSILGSGSGEEGTIRVEDHLGQRRGLKTLRALHMGQFGIDAQYGSVTGDSYPSNGSFVKQHRNKSRVATSRDFDASIRVPNTTTVNSAGLSTLASAYAASSFPPTGGKSFSVWVNFDSLDTSGQQAIFDAAHSDTVGSINLVYQGGIGLGMNLVNSGGSGRILRWNWSPTVDRWYHIVVLWDGNFANDPIAYIDTVSLGTPSTDTGVSSGTTLKQVQKLLVGDLATASGHINELKGRVSHLVVYKNNTSSKIATLYNGGSPLSSGLPDSGDIIDFWLLGNEVGLSDTRTNGVGAKIDKSANIVSIAGNNTILNATEAELATVTKGVNYTAIELITDEKYDNDFINSPIPRSEFQYSWVHAAISGTDVFGTSNQIIAGYAPKNGILSESDGFVDAIIFPSASTIMGSL